jgi:hypothetical protein
MPTVKREMEKGYGNAIVTTNVKSYANEPYFAKKAEEAKETLKKVGLPISTKK